MWSLKPARGPTRRFSQTSSEVRNKLSKSRYNIFQNQGTTSNFIYPSFQENLTRAKIDCNFDIQVQAIILDLRDELKIVIDRKLQPDLLKLKNVKLTYNSAIVYTITVTLYST